MRPKAMPTGSPASLSAIQAVPAVVSSSSSASSSSESSSRHDAFWISFPNSSQSSCRASLSAVVAWRITGSRSGSQELCEEIVRRQVLKGLEACARRADVDVTIERAHGLAHGEVSGRPGARAAEVAREEPVGGPLAEAAQRGQLRLHLVVGEKRQRLEVEVGAREPDHVLGLAPGEAEREELLFGRRRDPLTRGEHPDAAHLLAEPLDEPISDCKSRDERDLLRRDRADEHLERISRERRAEPGEADDERSKQLVSRRPPGERDEVEVEAEHPAHDRFD